MSAVLAPVKPAKKSKKSKEFENLVGPTDSNIDTQARERLVSSRVELYIKHPFFGNLATRLKLINADEWCGTAATDGRNFYYNSRFIMKLKQKEVVFLVGHEVLHVVYDHIGRREFRDPRLANIAADYAVNADLKRHKVGEFITSVPCLYEAKYDGKGYEYIYDDLLKDAAQDMNDLMDQLLDDHLGEDDADGDGDGDGKGGKGNRPRPMSQEEREQLKQEIKQNIINAARQSDAGSVPAEVQRMIKEITEPKMPWRELLSTMLTSTIKSDYSFIRPSRRGWHMDAIMPGMNPGEEVDIVVAIDTSGSIGDDDLKIFLGEVQGIMDSFDGYRIKVFSFDTQAYNLEEYTSENLDNIAGYEPKGGGGTDFDAIFDFLKAEDIQPERLVVFTDGYPYGSWGDPDYCDTTWIIHGDPNPNPPFGNWAVYSDHRDGK
jgi:predicted metal-dependent peptidase